MFNFSITPQLLTVSCSTKQNDVTLINEQVNDQALAIMRLVG